MRIFTDRTEFDEGFVLLLSCTANLGHVRNGMNNNLFPMNVNIKVKHSYSQKLNMNFFLEIYDPGLNKRLGLYNLKGFSQTSVPNPTYTV